MLKQIVYVSREAVPFDRARLTDLLDRARAFNRDHGITGVLLHASGRFAQCIEGRPADIDPLCQRIERDPRHADLVYLQTVTLAQRCFGEWSMGCVDVSDAEHLKLRNAEWARVVEQHDHAPWVSPGFVLMEALWNAYGAERY